MKQANSVTVRLNRQLLHDLNRACRESKRSRSDIIRDALQRHLALERFESLRRQVMPFAEARGYLTDEDVAGQVS